MLWVYPIYSPRWYDDGMRWIYWRQYDRVSWHPWSNTPRRDYNRMSWENRDVNWMCWNSWTYRIWWDDDRMRWNIRRKHNGMFGMSIRRWNYYWMLWTSISVYQSSCNRCIRQCDSCHTSLSYLALAPERDQSPIPANGGPSATLPSATVARRILMRGPRVDALLESARDGLPHRAAAACANAVKSFSPRIRQASPRRDTTAHRCRCRA